MMGHMETREAPTPWSSYLVRACDIATVCTFTVLFAIPAVVIWMSIGLAPLADSAMPVHEVELSAAIQVLAALAVASATASIALALAARQVPRRDYVILTPHARTATPPAPRSRTHG